MKRLILFRHGETERHTPSGEDFDRRLTVQGCEDSHLMGKVLAEAGLIPDLVLVSSALRAQETWDAAKAAFPGARVEVRPELYNSDRKDLWRIARKADGDTVMIVAHNPGVHALAVDLSVEGRDKGLARVQEGFPTAGAAAFELEGDSVKALGFYAPRDHGGEGFD